MKGIFQGDTAGKKKKSNAGEGNLTYFALFTCIKQRLTEQAGLGGVILTYLTSNSVYQAKA